MSAFADKVLTNSMVVDMANEINSETEYEMDLLPAGMSDIFGSLDTSQVPHKLRLGFDFYMLIFLNLDNKEYSVSTLTVIAAFQKLARVLSLKLSRESIRAIMQLQESELVSWKSFLSLIKGYETRGSYTRARSVISQSDLNVFSLRRVTEIYLTFPERIFLTIEDGSSSLVAQIISIFRLLVILLSTLGLVLESVPYFRYASGVGEPVADPAFGLIEIVTVSIFTVDYLTRLALVGFVRWELMDKQRLVSLSTNKGTIQLASSYFGRVFQFVKLPLSIVDLVAIVPFYVGLMVFAVSGNSQSAVFRIVRVIRLVSVLRLLRIRQFRDMQEILERAFTNSLAALGILIFIFAIVVLFFAVIIYFPEGGDWYAVGEIVNGAVLTRGAYYRANAVDSTKLELTPFTSIPASMWWALITALTIGYGDMVPASAWGQLVGSILGVSGIIVLAMPIAVIGSNFATEYSRFYGIKAQVSLSKQADKQQHLLARFTRSAVEAAPVQPQREPSLPEAVGEAFLKQMNTLTSHSSAFEGLRVNTQGLYRRINEHELVLQVSPSFFNQHVYFLE